MTIAVIRTVKTSGLLSRNNLQSLPLTSPYLLKGARLQRRNLWRCSHQKHASINEHAQRRMEKYRRICLSKSRSRGTHLPRRPHALHEHHQPWWIQGWGWGRFKSSFPGFRQGRPHGEDFWEAERARTQRRFDQIKKEIEADPYGALFGRRLEPWNSLDKMEKTFASMCRSVFGLDKDVGKAETPRSVDTTARASSAGKPSPQSTEEASSVSARNDAASSAFGMNDRDDLEFDPISGRMSLRKPKATSPVTKDPEHESKRVGYLSPVPESGDSLKEPTKTDSKSDVTEDSAPAAKAPGRLIYEDGEAHPVDTRASSCQNTEPPKVNADNPEEVPLTPPKYPPGTNTNGMLQSKTEVPPIEIVSEDNNSEPQGATWSENPRPKSDSKPHATPFTPSWYSEPVISKDRAEDLDLLSASDIRSTYDSRVPEQDSEGQKRARHRALEESFDTYTDPAGGLDAQAIRQKYQHYQKSESVERSASEPPSPEPIIRSDLESSEDLAASQLPIHDESTSTVGQPNETNKTSASATPAPEIYHVLAYDPSTFQMTHAETSSSTRAANEALHPAEVLPLLNNPAKFMPYISKMHADGYEIVSGSGDVLVFRRGTSDRAGASLADVDNIDANVRNEPLFTESTESPKRTQGNETGTAESASIPPDPPSSTKTAYSSGSSAKDESKLGRTLRRMFISGAATAATCYALGVVSEYFRTGGQDGRGIDGFTEFESERRQQEREERASRS